MMRKFSYSCAVILALFLVGCDEQTEESYRPTFAEESVVETVREYTIGIHPLHNPERLFEVFGPMAELLSNKIPNSKFRIEASRNYAAYDEKLYAGKFEFGLPNPFQTVNSLKHGYHVFGKMGDDANFRGIILVRKDSGIKSVTDLKGKAVSFPAPTAMAATMMPQYYLQSNGLNVMEDIEIRYVGSQESSVMNVFLGDVAAGATWPPPWRLLSKERPELAEQVYPIWETEPLPNNGLVVRDDVDPELVEDVASILFSLHETDEGRAILERIDLSQF